MKIPNDIEISAETYAFSKLLSYVKLQWPGYVIGKHHALIASYLEAIEDGRVNRLMLCLPPRFGKTLLTSEYFSAWYMGRNPSDQIIFCTYSQERAADVGKKVRNQMIDPLFNKIFPNCQIAQDSKSVSKVGTKEGGNFFAVGMGGALAGRGANCLSGETFVDTVDGKIKISTLYNMKNPPNILTFNHETSNIEHRKIIAKRKIETNEIIEIRTSNGIYLRCTPEHRIFIDGEGYKEARLCRSGDAIIFQQKKSFEQNMCNLQQKKEWSWSILSRVLSKNQKNSCISFMLLLQKNIRTISLRLRKSIKKRTQRFLLFFRMFTKSSCNKKQTEMRNLWKTNGYQTQQILFKGMSINKQKKISEIKRCGVSNLWSNFSSKIYTISILFQNLFKYRTFISYERFWKFTFQKWKKLSQTFFSYAESCFNSRQILMCCMQTETGILLHSKNGLDRSLFKIKSYYSPYQRESKRRQINKFSNNVLFLSHNSSQIKNNTISMVKKLCVKDHPVYDLQIHELENFFANGILVHNCLILDDVIKGPEEAESELFRAKMKDWYETTAYTRLMPKSAIIIINTRWHLDDLSGWQLKEHADEGWVEVKMPAISMSDDDAIGRKEGEALWPEAYSLERLLKIKKAIGTKAWNSLYQQSPIGKDGTIIQYGWLKHYTELPKKFKRIVQSWDTAFKPKQINDPSVCITFGETKSDYYVLDVFKRRMAYPDLRKQAMLQYKRKFNGHEVDVVICEDKASGQSLIQDLKAGSTVPIVPIQPESDKLTRMSSKTGAMEAGKFWLPKQASWLIDYETELTTFPFAAFDDQVDATSQYLKYATKPKYVRSLKPQFWK